MSYAVLLAGCFCCEGWLLRQELGKCALAGWPVRQVAFEIDIAIKLTLWMCSHWKMACFSYVTPLLACVGSCMMVRVIGHL